MRNPRYFCTQFLAIAGMLCAIPFCASAADEKFETLSAGQTTYTNVLVMSKNATDIFIKHSGGMASVKIKDLSPDLQKQFGFDAAKAEVVAKERQQANAAYVAGLKAEEKSRASQPKPAPPVPQKAQPAAPAVRQAPKLEVETWISSEPNTQGKWVLIDFWATWCGPCKQAIPHVNSLHRKFGDRVVVIGLSNESPRDVRAMKTPKMEYFSAVDTQARTARAFNVKSIPRVVLIDPNGFVRAEGHAQSLDEQTLERLLNQFK